MTGWLLFAGIVTALFLFDLLVKRGAVVRVLSYVLIALAFGAYVWMDRGADAGIKFFTGYTLEMTLSLDNVFVISLIFGALSIPSQYRERVLLIGIVTALVLRGVFIGAGVALVGAFDWLLIICGVFLIYTGIKMLFSDEPEEVDLEKNRVLKFLKRFLPVTSSLFDGRFFVRKYVVAQSGGAPSAPRFAVTPLFVALVLVEIADVVFAADSVPATLAVTTDPFLVYTSNIFAILGLRALYSVLERMVNAFEHLDKAIAVVLAFIGVKVVAAHTVHWEIDNALSLGVVLAVLAVGILASLWSRRSATETKS